MFQNEKMFQNETIMHVNKMIKIRIKCFKMRQLKYE